MGITREQYQLQLDRLIDAFGERGFSDQRSHMIWQIVEGLEYSSVISIVDDFIRNSKNAPLPAEFSVAAQGFEKKKKSLGEYSENPTCFDCHDSGFVRVERLATFEPWARWESGSACCHCDFGRRALEALRRKKNPVDLVSTWNRLWETSYRIVGRG